MQISQKFLTIHIFYLAADCGSGKELFYLVSQQPDFDTIYAYAKDPYEAKYQCSINKQESTGFKHFNDSKTFIEYSNDMDDIYKNTEEI